MTALQALKEQIATAKSEKTKLDIQGQGTKHFYGHSAQGERLSTTAYEGIVSHDPTELVVTARCGTPIKHLEAALAEKNQHLPFDPPKFDEGGTVGGMVATGLSGPARASVGALKDHILGVSLLDGHGEVLSFGGQVMKNVAGYDVSRLIAGSMGTLGLILEVSLKVMPMAPATATLRFDMDQATALHQLNQWGGQPLPLNASVWWDGTLAVRLRGALAAVQAAIKTMGGEVIEPTFAAGFWNGLRDHSDEFFTNAQDAVSRGISLWRLSVPQTTPPFVFSGEQLIEWHGAQRWLVSATPPGLVRDAAARAGGHATLFMGRDKSIGVFAPLTPPIERIHRQLKNAFDPDGLFNPGRLYPGL
jgi:glycolate oxidase FAD binding subunit